jgi:hypothetical protein
MLHILRFFSSSKCRLFHKATFLGSCVIRILHTGCAKIKKQNSGAKRLIPQNCNCGKAKRTLPEDGPGGPKHVGANVETF